MIVFFSFVVILSLKLQASEESVHWLACIAESVIHQMGLTMGFPIN